MFKSFCLKVYVCHGLLACRLLHTRLHKQRAPSQFTPPAARTVPWGEVPWGGRFGRSTVSQDTEGRRPPAVPQHMCFTWSRRRKYPPPPPGAAGTWVCRAEHLPQPARNHTERRVVVSWQSQLTRANLRRTIIRRKDGTSLFRPATQASAQERSCVSLCRRILFVCLHRAFRLY